MSVIFDGLLAMGAAGRRGSQGERHPRPRWPLLPKSVAVDSSVVWFIRRGGEGGCGGMFFRERTKGWGIPGPPGVSGPMSVTRFMVLHA